MKKKIYEAIDEFVNLCNAMGKTGSGSFAKENFPKLVEAFWDGSKTDEENLKYIKDMFEVNKRINMCTFGVGGAAETIEAFQKGWLSKI